MKLNEKDAANLIDALKEWYEVCEPKELEENEVGLNSKRYEDLMTKLKVFRDDYRDDNFGE